MASSIDATFPVSGIDQSSQGFRDNFSAAKTEIEALQTATSNLDNTSDADKPVSTAQQTALDAKADLSGGNTFDGGQAGSVTTLTYGATVTPDFSDNNYFTLTATGNFTLANPTNQTVGQGGSIRIAQDATGSRTIAYGANWVFEGGTAPALTTTASAVDRLDYLIMASGEIHARLALDVS